MINLRLTDHEWATLRDGFADIACWHLGFKAASPTYEPPPQLSELLDLMSQLKYKVNKQVENDAAQG